MSIYRKDESGIVVKTAGNLVQRWNDRIFLTTHSVVDEQDYYDIEPAANKYITGLTDYTEFQLYISEPNETQNVNIRFNNKTLQLSRSDDSDIAVGFLARRQTWYTLNTNDGKIWMDPLLQPTPDTYRGIFTYALQTWDSVLVLNPQVGETAIALDTDLPYEYDGTSWDVSGDPVTPLNGWYWMIEFFPDYYFGNGKIVWNGEAEAWNIYTARVSRPDNDTIVTNENATFSVAKTPHSLITGPGLEITSFDGSEEVTIAVAPSIVEGNQLTIESDDRLYVRVQHADETDYDNIESGLIAENVQDGIDELADQIRTVEEAQDGIEESITDLQTTVGSLDTLALHLQSSNLAAAINTVWLDIRNRLLSAFKQVSGDTLNWTTLIDGVNQTFPIPSGVNANGYFIVFVNGVLRQFTISGTNIILEEAPVVNSIITVTYLDNSIFNIGGI